MTTIYRDKADRLSVADAKRLILEALPPERSAEVYARVDENGNFDFEGPVEIKEVHGVQIYASFIDRDFLPICEQLSIQPRMRYRPTFMDYTWQSLENDTLYTIGHDEFSRVAELFGLAVAVRLALEPQAAPEATEGASVSTDPIQDPERRLARLRELGGTAKYARGEWSFKGTGALLKSEESEKRKRRSEKTIRADLRDAAQAERDATKDAAFTHGLGQLTR